MNVAQQKQQKGFTIIEVILVLAIAGLIFLMVFLALPALQRGQRDTQRKQDLSKVLTAVQNYQGNSRGSVPTTQDQVDTLKASYLKVGGDTFTDPTGKEYTLKYGSGDGTSYSSDTPTIYYTNKAICGSGGTLTTGQAINKVAVQMPLEGSGLACENN